MFSRSVRVLSAFILMIGLSFISTPSGADLTSDIEGLKSEQNKVREEKSAKAKSIDAATAEAAELAEALKALNDEVNTQQAKIDAVENLSKKTAQRVTVAEDQTAAVERRISELESELAELAISGFRNRNQQTDLEVFGAESPTKAATMSRLSKTVARSEVEAAEDLKQNKGEFEALVAEAVSANEELVRLTETLDADKKQLEVSRDKQAKITDEAEERLEAELAEAAVLEERDKELADSIRAKNSSIARQAQIASRNRPASPKPSPVPAVVPASASGKTVNVTNYAGQKIEVDSSIAGNVQALLDASSAAGIKLGGWGYRDANRQIQLRIQNCGGNSNFAIYQKSSSTCRPPTARPGRSNHERGLAIDFTSGGSTIKSRNSAAFRWLRGNAAAYGLKNLPSEPWHWSVNGN